MILSPGFSTARKTASLACAPEWGCTLAAISIVGRPKIFLMRSIASVSTTSTNSQPP
jgi:hypothetical protein